MDQEIFRKSQNINVSKLLMKEGEFRVQQHFVKKKKTQTKTTPLATLETTRFCFFRMESNSFIRKSFPLENHRLQKG